MAKKILVVHSISFTLSEENETQPSDPTVSVAVLPDGLLAESGIGEEFHAEINKNGLVNAAPLIYWILRRLGVSNDNTSSVSVPLAHTVEAMQRSLNFET